jgi:hypothetical protein
MTIPAPNRPPLEGPTLPPGSRPQPARDPSPSPTLPLPPMVDPVPPQQVPAIVSDLGEELLHGDAAG